jgi:hypothetical protein
VGISKRRIRSLSLPLSIALMLMYIIREDCKTFFPMSLLYGFLLAEEGTDRFLNVGKKLPLLAT